MKNSIVTLIALAFVLNIVGCGTKQVTGNETLHGASVTQIEEKLVVNKTTKKEVENWLGTPSGISKDKDGNDIWSYSYGSSESRVRGETFIPFVGGFLGGANTKSEGKTLHITFNRAGIITSYGFEGTDGAGKY